MGDVAFDAVFAAASTVLLAVKTKGAELVIHNLGANQALLGPVTGSVTDKEIRRDLFNTLLHAGPPEPIVLAAGWRVIPAGTTQTLSMADSWADSAYGDLVASLQNDGHRVTHTAVRYGSPLHISFVAYTGHGEQANRLEATKIVAHLRVLPASERHPPRFVPAEKWTEDRLVETYGTGKD